MNQCLARSGRWELSRYKVINKVCGYTHSAIGGPGQQILITSKNESIQNANFFFSTKPYDVTTRWNRLYQNN